MNGKEKEWSRRLNLREFLGDSRAQWKAWNISVRIAYLRAKVQIVYLPELRINTKQRTTQIPSKEMAQILFHCQEQELKSTFWEENMAERSYWKESVAKRRMITDTAWTKIYWYAREGYIRYCHGRRGKIQRETVGRFSCQSDGFIYFSKYSYLCRLKRETDHRAGIGLILSYKSTNGRTFFHFSYGMQCPTQRLATTLEYNYEELLRGHDEISPWFKISYTSNYRLLHQSISLPITEGFESLAPWTLKFITII